MNILVTGGGGFVGHQLVSLLLEKPDWHVTAIDNFSFGSRSFLKHVPNLEILELDIRDRKALFEALRNPRFDAVYHLAAIHFIPYCNEHPNEALETNVWGTKNLFDVLKITKPKFLVNISSAAVYDVSDQKHREEDLISPLDVYGRSKAMAEDLAHLFFSQTQIPTVNVRLFNVIGRNETNDHVIPAIMRQLVEEKEIKIGNLFPKRSYIDVRDVTAALKQFLNRIPSGYHTVNLGGGQEYSVQEILDAISKILKRPLSICSESNLIRQTERPHLRPSLDAIRQLINWEPKYQLEDTLKEILEETGLLKCESLL